MTRSKRAFAELFATAQGRGDDETYIAELCEKYSMIELIYEMKKYEEQEKSKTPEPAPEPAPEPPPRPSAPRPPSPDPVREFLTDIWSRLSS